jgi:hypothetical protein
MRNNALPFTFAPVSFIPFRDPETIARLRAIKREQSGRNRRQSYHLPAA